MKMEFEIHGPARIRITGENLSVETLEPVPRQQRLDEAIEQERQRSIRLGSRPVETKSATASHGEAEAHSADHVRPADMGGAGANTGGGHEVTPRKTPLQQAESGSSTATLSAVYVLRPYCRNPEVCGGYSDKHCHGCEILMNGAAA